GPNERGVGVGCWRLGADMITHEIIGDDMQAVVLTLGSGDVVRAEAGAMMFMTDRVEMDAKMGGGLLGGPKRKLLPGGSLVITFFRSGAADAKVAFAGPYPGKIIHIALAGQQALLCQRDAFLCATGDVDLSIAFTKRLGAGFFGGEGFILQKMTGTGELFIHSGGTVLPVRRNGDEQPEVDTRAVQAAALMRALRIERGGGIETPAPRRR